MPARSLRLPLALLLAAFAACSGDPEQAKRAAFDKGNGYLAQQKYGEAIIEYRRALERDPNFIDAHIKLAEAYLAADEGAKAFREYIAAADMRPDDLGLQVRVGQLLLKAGRHADAIGRAKIVLDRDANDVNALILLGNATAGLPDIKTGLESLEAALKLDPGRAGVYVNIGVLQLKQGNREEAEAAFRRAVGVDPNSADARLALGNFYWANGRLAEAEAGFKRALELDSKHLLANRAMAVLCATTNRLPEAEGYLKTIAAAAPDSRDQLSLVDYYLRAHRYDAALPLLTALRSDKAAAIGATLRIAAIDHVQGRQAEATRAVDEIIAKFPFNTDALLMKAQFLVEANKQDEALGLLKAAAMASPRSDTVQYALGKLYAETRHPIEAASAFEEAVRLNPHVAGYLLDVARFDLSRGNADAALRHAAEAAVSAPGNADVQLMLVRALIARRLLREADSEMQRLLAAHPQSAAVQAEAGALRFLQGNRAGARSAFEQAVALDPTADEALSALIQMDIVDKKPQQAIARAEARLAARPTDVGAMLTVSGTYVLAGESAKAESMLRKIIETAPSTFKAYALLGNLYATAGKLDHARALFEDLARRNPKVIGAYIMVGLVLEAQHRLPEAMTWYERALKADPRAAVAANNLAWLLLTSGGDIERALRLARVAKAQLPDNPIANDTLGWVFYQKDVMDLGIQALLLSVEGEPRNATYHYHLGMLYAKAGNSPRAKEQLERALALNPSVEGAAEARQMLDAIAHGR